MKQQHTPGKAFISQELRELVNQDEDRVTIVHCRYFAETPSYARVWPTTYLVENDGRIRELLHAENIATYPAYQLYDVSRDYIYFTLIFERLSDECTSFHIEEIIPDTNGFISDEVARNKTGVYQVELFAP
jgi:hypothetical protein